jgi:hypothetical protein
MKFVDHPQYSVHFHVMLGRELAKLAVSAEQDAAGMTFRKRKSKSVMNGDGGNLPYDLLRPQDSVAGQVDHLESSPYQSIFLSGCKFKQFLFKKGVRDQ